MSYYHLLAIDKYFYEWMIINEDSTNKLVKIPMTKTKTIHAS